MALVSRTITLQEQSTILLVGYANNTTSTSLTFVINGVEASLGPVVTSPSGATGAEPVIFGVTTLAAGCHEIVMSSINDDLVSGWLWVVVGQDTDNTDDNTTLSFP